MNLYPYNYWILWASIALLVIFLIMTLVHLFGLLKSVKYIMPAVNNMNGSLTSLQESASRMPQKKKSESPISAAKLLSAFLLLRAVKKEYDRSSENGIKEYGRSAIRVIEKRNRRDNIQKELRRFR